jgi:OmpA-OmpF porin, OOP family
MPARLFAALIVLSCLAMPARAQDGSMLVVEPYAGSEEHAGSRIEEAFGASHRITGFADRAVQSEPFEGRVSLRRFRSPEGRSTLEILRNYQAALAERGFVTEWECDSRQTCGTTADGGWIKRNGMNLGIGSKVRYLTGSMPYEGGTLWVSVGAGGSNHYVQVLQPVAMQGGNVRVLDAAAMASALDSAGRIAVENIYFDFGSAALLPESAPALTEIAALLANRPDLAIYVVGHTDSVGSLEANLDLSRARAAAVVQAVETDHGIAAGRAVPAGVGPLAPVAPNTTDEGRALNRRVEVVAR